MHIDKKIAYCKDIAKHLQLNPPKDKWRFSLAAYFYSLIDIASAINILYLHKDTTSIPILYRSFLEAYFDLYNLAHDRKYGYKLDANKSKEWNRLLKHTKNPYIKGISDDENWNAFIEKLKNDLDNNTPQHKPLNVSEKFDIAGQHATYETIYNEMCSDAHNNLRSVYARFMPEGVDGNKYKADLCSQP